MRHPGRQLSGRRLPQAEADRAIMPLSPPASQAPAERRVLESQVRALLARLAPGHERLVGALRRALRKRLPTAYELVYEYASWLVISYAPSERGYEGVVAIRGSAEGVALYLTGKGLPDPEKLLQGSGKLARFIPVAS